MNFIYNPLNGELDAQGNSGGGTSKFMGVSGICTDTTKKGARIARIKFTADGTNKNYCIVGTICFAVQQTLPYGDAGGSRSSVATSGKLDFNISLGLLGDQQTRKILFALNDAVNISVGRIRIVRTYLEANYEIYDVYLETAYLGERFFYTYTTNANTDSRVTFDPIISEDLIQTPYTQITAQLYGDDKTKSYNINSETDVTLNHNLNKFPSVTIVDSNGKLVLADVTYIDANDVQITWNSEFTGSIYLN